MHLKNLRPHERAIQRFFKPANRERLAAILRVELPWARIVAGAPRYPFILIDRGERIAGTSPGEPDRGQPTRYCGSAWSRPVLGSRYIDWRVGEPPACWEYIDKRFDEEGRRLHSCAKLVETLEGVPYTAHDTRAWFTMASEALACHAERLLRPVDEHNINAQLRQGEWFEIRGVKSGDDTP